MQPGESFDLFYKDLNTEQVKAVMKGLSSESISLIHGPPGTGKTKTACELIYQAVTAKRLKVLACAASNIAVDNLCMRLKDMKDLKICRIGHPARISQ